MAYLEELLSRGERVVYVGRQHTFVLVSNIVAETFLIVMLVAAGIASQSAFGNRFIQGIPVGQLVFVVCGVISVIILISAFLDYLRWNNEEYVVTDQRVIQLRGIFSKSATDSSLEKITDLELRQSWLGRIFNFGDIQILTASDLGISTMRKIAQPIDFKRAMLEAKNHQSRGYGYMDPQTVSAYMQPPPAYRGPQADIEQTLQKLADLRDQGLLSQDEFEAKRRDLLRRI